MGSSALTVKCDVCSRLRLEFNIVGEKWPSEKLASPALPSSSLLNGRGLAHRGATVREPSWRSYIRSYYLENIGLWPWSFQAERTLAGIGARCRLVHL